MLTNAHLHFRDSFSPHQFSGQLVCFSTGSVEEWRAAIAFSDLVASYIDFSPGPHSAPALVADLAQGGPCLLSAGLHPWTLEEKLSANQKTKYAADQASSSGTPVRGDPCELLDWLEDLLAKETGRVAAIGECGIDLYSPAFKSLLPEQLAVFEKQLQLASAYKKPLVLHCRRSIQYFFQYKKELKKLPSVIFHGFPGSLQDCRSLLENGINAFFSFGGVFLRGGRRAAECVKNLPEDRLLLETDAEDDELLLLDSVFKAAAEIRSLPVSTLEEVTFRNFCRAYCLV